MCVYVIFCLLSSLRLVSSFLANRPLEGVTLRCCTIEESPVVIRDPTAPLGFRGLAFDVLREMEDSLGFKCSEVTLSKLSFTPFIESLHACDIGEADNCTCDLAVAGFGINSYRFSKADFLPRFSDGSYRVITHWSNTYGDADGAWFFFQAFDPVAWLLIFLLILCFAFLMLFDRNFSPSPPYVPLPDHHPWWDRAHHFLLHGDFPRRLRHAIGVMALRFIGQGSTHVEGDNATGRARGINFLAHLLGLFLVLAFEAATTASLLQESIVSPFRTIDDFKTCRIAPEEICVPAGGAERTFFDTAILKQPCYANTTGPRYIEGTASENPYQAMVRAVATKQCKYGLASQSTLKAAANGEYCGKIHLVGKPFFRAGGSFVLPRNSNFTEIMSKATYDIINRDNLPSLDEAAESQGECTLVPPAMLGFKQLRFFFLLAYGSVTGILISMVCCPPRVKRSEPQERGHEEADSNV